MAEWWINNVGQNMLKGIDEDAQVPPGEAPCSAGTPPGTNPPMLDDATIASFFNRIPEAVASYLRLRSTLLPEEIARLDKLLAMALNIELDNVVLADAIQNKWNREGVRTVGPRGGTRIGGNR